jgi:alpha-glucosidase
MWDGAMNYKGFTRPLRKLFGDGDWAMNWQMKGADVTGRDAGIFAEEVLGYRALLPGQISQGQFNLLTCHDIDRWNTSAGFSRKAMLSSLLFLFTFPGVANVYYGDEINIGGRRGSDAGRRFQMPWDESEWDLDVLNMYKDIIKYRKGSSAIKKGSFMPLVINEGIVSYARFDGQSTVLLAYSPVGASGEICLDGLGVFSRAEVVFRTEGADLKPYIRRNRIFVDLDADDSVLVELG